MPGTLFATCFTIMNLDLVHSLEASARDVSNEFTKSMFLGDNTRFQGMRCKGLFLYGTCHKDLEQIGSMLSVELIFNSFCHCEGPISRPVTFINCFGI